MCGIAGVVERWEAPDRPKPADEILRRMAGLLHHRGPDDSGVYEQDGVGLAFARLSIIDVAGGHQPMSTADGRLTIVFNGEIYNFRPLRHELEQQGYRFRTGSDTEVLLALYQQHGDALLQRVNGMFAFAIHDRERQRVLLARDRLGVKPLYYALDDRRLVFGSEIKAVLCHPDVDDAIDPAGLGDYLTYGYIPGPRTIYRSIRVLPPAHQLSLARGQQQTWRYWHVQRRDDLPRTLPEATEALAELLDDAVKIRLQSEVPLGALLSGGIDSGLVVALMSRHMQEPVRTFSVGFQEASHDELPDARRVAELYGTRHTEIVCRPQVAELLPRIARAFDQPFGDSSAVPTWYVSEVARRDVTVALSGDGGDEGFAGYRRHLLAWRRGTQRREAGVTGALARALAPAVPPLLRGAQRLRRVGLSDAEFQVDCLVLAEDRLKLQLAGDRLREEASAFDSVDIGLSSGGEFEQEGGIRRFQHQDLTLYLPNDVLEKVDRMSMAHSLEVRGPLLDYRVVEFGLNLAPQLKVDGASGKLPLRALAQRLLPPGHLARPKSGFGIPVARWLRNELRETLDDCLTSSSLAADGWLAQPFLHGLLRRHHDGRDHGTILWSLLMLELWYRTRTAEAPVGAARR